MGGAGCLIVRGPCFRVWELSAGRPPKKPAGRGRVGGRWRPPTCAALLCRMAQPTHCVACAYTRKAIAMPIQMQNSGKKKRTHLSQVTPASASVAMK